MPPAHPLYTIETLIREEWGRIIASIMQTTQDLQLAEDSVQDAVEIALAKWKTDGLPRSPAGWLVTVARRKAIDRLRRQKTFAAKQNELSYLADLQNLSEEPSDEDIIDKRLELIFTCCHPSLAEKTKVALTLRIVGGLTTEEIARAFLDDSKTLGQRLARAKKKIKLAAIPYEVPSIDVLPSRVREVLSVIYLIFNEGYAASSGDALMRVDLVKEAIRLARIMRSLMANETEVAGLLALMLLHDARRPARLDPDGRFVPLEHQNRQRWKRAQIEEGTSLLKKTLKQQRVGPYQLQASISALHVEAPSWEETDWAQIVALYNLLYKIQPSPVIRINQVMAVSHAVSVKAALDMLNSMADEKALKKYKAYYLVRADLLERSGQIEAAKAQIKRAISLASNQVEIAFLEEKLLGL